MSVLTAIFQAIFQTLCRIFPISESAHSSLFHFFADRSSGTCSALTGIIHIGIALGIIAALYKTFISLFNEFVFSVGDLFKKKLRVHDAPPARTFMYMTLISYVPMLLWLIPCGESGLLYSVLRRTSYNNSILEDGLVLIAMGVMLVLASRQMQHTEGIKGITHLAAVVVGVTSVLLASVSGFSLIGGVFSILILFGVSRKLAFKYAFVISAPVLLVMGILEICLSVTPAGVVSVIIGIVLSAVLSFFGVRVLRYFINSGWLKYFGYYDISLGLISGIIGVVYLIIK